MATHISKRLNIYWPQYMTASINGKVSTEIRIEFRTYCHATVEPAIAGPCKVRIKSPLEKSYS